jgi:hypothetical protein
MFIVMFVLAALAVVGIVASFRVVATDGYRRVPARRL